MAQAEIANPGVSWRRDWRPFLSRYATLGALIALILFNLAITNNFASWRTLDVNLTQVASIVIVGVGMTLVIATGGIDLSVGSLMAIAGALAPIIFLGKIYKFPEIHLAVAAAMVVSILVAGAFGWFNGWLITRFRIQPIIATLVLFIAGRGIAQVSTNGNLQPFKLDEFQWIGLGRIFAPGNPTANGFKGIPDQVLIMVVIVALAAWALNRRCSDAKSSRSVATSARRGWPACRSSPSSAGYIASAVSARKSPDSSTSRSTLPATPISSAWAWSWTRSRRWRSAAPC